MKKCVKIALALGRVSVNPDYGKHFPVMLPEVLMALSPQNGEVYVDATFGNGGYSEAILNSADCKVIALDRDPDVLARSVELKVKYGDRFEFRAGQFGDFADLVTENINGAVFDIGVSSMQLDEAERGFSFSKDAPLDMRMSQNGVTAADLVNTLSESELADIIYNYGEERKSRQIAHRIIEYRKIKPISGTKELADIICSVVKNSSGGINPATRTFQALRIAVNNELEELSKGLYGAAKRLVIGGRLVVVDFHSLEDRIVKNYFKDNSAKSKHVSKYAQHKVEDDRMLFGFCSKVILPSEEELKINPRSRSAKLRYAIKKNYIMGRNINEQY